ncbi:MOSC domain-containing protein YiiM [Fluviicoccus keumensis]|uniref:MOSC domain-containing protein YiiM n=1 Tax=Fluviicoccus keumensis TaxID=1435465 RepID=A0A4Q7ZCQ2_9GAMM|nr:MOSC domain-containing protein [Fluviicoccus keumensis]RZU47984.1 MOSC domain-containing protein YiiM [Fluviicoccus keumensis]
MPALPSSARVLRLQIGEAMPFAREQTSAIHKYAVDQAMVTTDGLTGDEQADPFFHGGPFQAVHQMPLRVYALIRQAFPGVTVYEGGLGENLIASDMDEAGVCIGDIVRIGGVRLQVTRPRRPCWKIDALLDQRGVAKFLQDQGCVGWYYRVLQPGAIRVGDACVLEERPHAFATLARLWTIYNDKAFRDPEEIGRWLAIEALERSFKVKLGERLPQ